MKIESSDIITLRKADPPKLIKKMRKYVLKVERIGVVYIRVLFHFLIYARRYHVIVMAIFIGWVRLASCTYVHG